MPPVQFATFALFMLWDYYIPAAGGKVLDYLGIAILVLSLMPRVAFGDWRPLAITSTHFLFLLTLLPLLALGIVRGGFLTSAAFLLGCLFVYSVYFNEDIDYQFVYRQMGWLIVLCLIPFYIQFATFWLTGYLINYHAWIGAADPRVLVGALIRAGGLNQEPNGFCLTLLMLNAVRLFCPKPGRDYLLPISLVTLVVSQSLWGIGAAIFLMLCWIYMSEAKVRRVPIVLPVTAGIVGLAALLIDWPTILELVFSEFTATRLLDIANDPSAQQRFTGSGGFAVDLRFFVGHGPSTLDFQDYLGINGISFYVYGFGLVGYLLFLAFVFRVSGGQAIIKVAMVVLAMSTYPLFTYAFWWAWLAILVKANPEEFARAGQWYALADSRRRQLA